MSLTSTLQKSALKALRSDAVVSLLVSKVYTGVTPDDAATAANEVLTHITLHNADAVQAACGDYFAPLQAAATAEETDLVQTLAAQIVEEDQKAAKVIVQKYVDNLQYKHSEDNGQDQAAAADVNEPVPDVQA